MESQYYKILLVDDEADIIEFLGYNLKKEGYQVLTASNGLDALKIAEKEIPHLILLDVMMPEMDGVEVCEMIKQIPSLSRTIIAFLTARTEDYSQIAGFDAGADDYINKPIKPKLLLSRIKALLRRYEVADASNKSEDHILNYGNIVIDREKYRVIKNNIEIIFPKKEFELLVYLATKPEKVFTRDEIYNAIWGNEVIVGDRTIDVHIRKLREKLGDEYFETIKGVGYRFVLR